MARTAVRLAPYGPPSRAALTAVIAEAKHNDPLAPVTVVVPNNYAGLALRRALAVSTLPGSSQPGLVNVRFMVLARVIELVGAPRLATRGRRPLTAPYRAEAVRAAVAANPGPFADVALLGSTERSLQATFRDLAGTSNAALDALAGINRRSAHVVALYRDFRVRTADLYDAHDLAQAATESTAAGSAALTDIGRVIIYLPRTLTVAEHDFVAALAAAEGVDVLVGLTGDEDVDDPVREAWDALGAVDEIDGALTPPVGTGIVAVPDPEEEMREAVRQISSLLLAGTPLHRMAILYRHASPYGLLAAEQLQAANLPWNGPATRQLGQTLAGRTLLGFLGLPDQRFRREAVAGWLNSAPVLDMASGAVAPAHRWETLARAAGVVEGIAQWRCRLAQHARSLENERTQLENAGDDQAWRIRRVEHDRDDLARLRTFIDDLADQAASAGLRTWSDFSGWARGALNRYLGGEGHTAGWPEEETEAYRQVLQELDQLNELDAVREAIDSSTFRAAVAQLLERAAGRVGRFGEGVFVGRLADAAGVDFDAVFILGMSDGAMPPGQREDPLLLDSEREGAGIEPRSHRTATERREYLAALASAEQRTLVFPRADVRGRRARRPSRWVIETACVLAGERIFASELDPDANRPWFRELPSFEWSVTDGGEPAQSQEYDLRSLLRWRYAGHAAANHYLAASEPALANGLTLTLARRSGRFTRWDGHIPATLARSPLAGHPVSATALQSWAECPFRYFLGHVLRVSELELPETELQISPLEKGTLIHRVLDRFLRELPPRTEPAQPWTVKERARMRQISEQECDSVEHSGRSGHVLLWELERPRILRDLERFLDEDEALRQRLGTVTVASELPFGLDGEESATVELAPGRAVQLRGKIDRVDRAIDGSQLVVIDYKTGNLRDVYNGLDNDPVQGGRLLQLPIYATAARERYALTEVKGFYWFVNVQGDVALRGYTLDAERDSRFVTVLRVISEGIEGGVFPLRPGPQRQGVHEHCRFCPYSTLCPADRGATWRRKRGAPEIATYRALAEPEGEA